MAIEEKQDTQAAYEMASRAVAKASDRAGGFGRQLEAIKAKIVQLQQQYDQACKSAAAGEAIDPGPFSAQLQIERDRQHGTELLYNDARAEAQSLAEEALRTSRVLREEQWKAEEERLVAASVAADKGYVEAAKTAQHCEMLRAQAVGALDQFRKKRDRERREL